MDETPAYLICSGQYAESQRILSKISRVNGKHTEIKEPAIIEEGATVGSFCSQIKLLFLRNNARLTVLYTLVWPT